MSDFTIITTAAPGRPQVRATSWLLVAVLLTGPVVTVDLLVAAVTSGTLTTLSPAHYLVTALLFWSPLPFSVPAVLLERHRDAALPWLRGLIGWPLRAVLLLPYLVLARRSEVRIEAGASLLGFAAAVLIALPHLT